MNRFTEQFNTEANDIRLTGAERRRILSSMRAGMRPVQSPYFIRFLSIQRFAVGFAVLVLAFTGTAYASTYALPGDLLYPVKVSVAEPIEGSFAFSDEAKLAWHAGVAEERFSEAEALTNRGTFDEKTGAELAMNVNEHAKAIDAIARRVGVENPISEDRIAANFSASVATKNTAILAAGKQSTNTIAMRASGDFVVQVAADAVADVAAESAAGASLTQDAPAPSAKMFMAMMAPEPQAPETAADLSVRAHAAFETASTTLLAADLSDSASAQAESDIAKLANLLVKAEAELQIGDEEAAAADFTRAIEEAEEIQGYIERQEARHDDADDADPLSPLLN